jgi:cytochrome c553
LGETGQGENDVIADRSWHIVAAAALIGSPLVANAAVGNEAAGARLAAGRCAPCHSSTDAIHATVPLLEGQPTAYFLAQWRAFRQRERTAPIMVNLAAELSAQDVDDLAEYYAARAPARAASSPGDDAGRTLADRMQCASCHGRGRYRVRTTALQGLRVKRHVTPLGRCN